MLLKVSRSQKRTIRGKTCSAFGSSSSRFVKSKLASGCLGVIATFVCAMTTVEPFTVAWS